MMNNYRTKFNRHEGITEEALHSLSHVPKFKSNVTPLLTKPQSAKRKRNVANDKSKVATTSNQKSFRIRTIDDLTNYIATPEVRKKVRTYVKDTEKDVLSAISNVVKAENSLKSRRNKDVAKKLRKVSFSTENESCAMKNVKETPLCKVAESQYERTGKQSDCKMSLRSGTVVKRESSFTLEKSVNDIETLKRQSMGQESNHLKRVTDEFNETVSDISFLKAENSLAVKGETPFKKEKMQSTPHPKGKLNKITDRRLTDELEESVNDISTLINDDVNITLRLSFNIDDKHSHKKPLKLHDKLMRMSTRSLDKERKAGAIQHRRLTNELDDTVNDVIVLMDDSIKSLDEKPLPQKRIHTIDDLTNCIAVSERDKDVSKESRKVTFSIENYSCATKNVKETPPCKTEKPQYGRTGKQSDPKMTLRSQKVLKHEGSLALEKKKEGSNHLKSLMGEFNESLSDISFLKAENSVAVKGETPLEKSTMQSTPHPKERSKKNSERRLTDELEQTVNDVSTLINDSNNSTFQFSFAVENKLNHKKPLKMHEKLMRRSMNTSGKEKKAAATQHRRLTNELDDTVNDVTLLMDDSIKLSDEKPLSQKRYVTNIKTLKTRELRENAVVLEKKLADKHVSFTTESSSSDIKNFKKMFSPKITTPNRSKSSVKKMPNFNLIHQKGFEKMEDIASFSKRKQERAKILLSGKKPTVRSPVMKRHLEFGSKKKVQFVDENKSPPTKVPLVNKEKIQKAAIRKYGHVTPEGFTRFGFRRIEIKQAERKEEVKCVANKIKSVPAKKHTEKNRGYIQGVRSNRRFDLLMQMRMK